MKYFISRRPWTNCNGSTSPPCDLRKIGRLSSANGARKCHVHARLFSPGFFLHHYLRQLQHTLTYNGLHPVVLPHAIKTMTPQHQRSLPSTILKLSFALIITCVTKLTSTIFDSTAYQPSPTITEANARYRMLCHYLRYASSALVPQDTEDDAFDTRLPK